MTSVLLAGLLALARPCSAGAAMEFVAGSPDHREFGIRLVTIAPTDGNPLVETCGGRPCLRTNQKTGNPYLYFDVSRKHLRTCGYEPYRIEATIEYFDDFSGQVALQYDAMGEGVENNFRQVVWSASGLRQWRTITVHLENAEFRNGQQGRADLRLAAMPGTDLCVASVVLRVVAASNTSRHILPPPEPRFPGLDEISIRAAETSLAPASKPNEAERIAIERLQWRLADVGAKWTYVPGRRHQPGTLTIVVGRWRTGMARRYPRTARLLRRLQADPIAHRRRDGYVVCVERVGVSPIVCAVGLASPGAVYAIGHLQSRLLRDKTGPALVLRRQPSFEAPALDCRELYLNIGYGLGRPGITPEFFTDEDWQHYIDHLVTAGYNAWSFYLWADSGLIHPVAQVHRALNLRLHERLRKAIAYSHRRGLRVGMHFSPTLLPVELWNQKPAIRATLEYQYPGTVCPSHPEAKRLMRDVYTAELRWFRDVDFYSIWFYDVGGCFCDKCRIPENQRLALLDQVQTFAEIAHGVNPGAVFQIMTWAIWRYEKRHGYAIRDRFVTDTLAWFRRRRWPLVMADGIYVDPGTQPLFPLIVRSGTPAKAFLYQTNIETGQPFPILLTRYLAKWTPALVRAGATSAFLMRQEAGTKLADDFVAGAFLWNPWVSPSDALLACARSFTASVQASRLAWLALHKMDAFAWFGHAGGAAGTVHGEAIARLTASAQAASPPGVRPRLDWLVTAGKAYRILGRAVDAYDEEDGATIARLDREFSETMRRSRLFRHQAEGAPYWQNFFRNDLVRYFYAGWRSSHF